MKNLVNKITKFYTGLIEIHHLQTDKNKRINNDHPFAILLNALLGILLDIFPRHFGCFMVVLDGCYFIRLVVFWLGYAKVSYKVNRFTGEKVIDAKKFHK
jgi:hypothetical protein